MGGDGMRILSGTWDEVDSVEWLWYESVYGVGRGVGRVSVSWMRVGWESEKKGKGKRSKAKRTPRRICVEHTVKGGRRRTTTNNNDCGPE